MKQAVAQERQCGHGNQADPPVQGEQDREHPEDHQRVGAELQNGIREDVLQIVRIPGDSAHQIARHRPVVKRQ